MELLRQHINEYLLNVNNMNNFIFELPDFGSEEELNNWINSLPDLPKQEMDKTNKEIKNQNKKKK